MPSEYIKRYKLDEKNNPDWVASDILLGYLRDELEQVLNELKYSNVLQEDSVGWSVTKLHEILLLIDDVKRIGTHIRTYRIVSDPTYEGKK